MNSNIHLFTIAQTDPWKPYDNPGKKPPKPGVPEASDYGVVFMFICLVIVIAWRYELRKKWDNRNKK
jgi:hypothetical protein